MNCLEQVSVLIFKGLITYFDDYEQVKKEGRKLFKDFEHSQKEVEDVLAELFELNYSEILDF